MISRARSNFYFINKLQWKSGPTLIGQTIMALAPLKVPINRA